MKVILKQTVEKLGSAGEIVEVKEGFARNFLLAKDLAAPASSKLISKVQKENKLKQKKAIAQKEKLEGKIKEWDKKTLPFKVKVNAQNHLYKAITEKDIAKVTGLNEKYFPHLALKTIGSHPIKASGQNTEAQIIVSIQAEK